MAKPKKTLQAVTLLVSLVAVVAPPSTGDAAAVSPDETTTVTVTDDPWRVPPVQPLPPPPDHREPRPLEERKRELEDFLQTSYLSDVPLSEQEKAIPEYIQELFEDFQYEDLTDTAPTLPGQKAWGMRPEQVFVGSRQLELSFPVLPEIQAASLTRAELVLARRRGPARRLDADHVNTSLPYVRLCLPDSDTVPRQCHVTQEADPVRVPVRHQIYDVYNVTRVLLSLMRATSGGEKAWAAACHIPRVHAERLYKTLTVGGQNALLVAYHNVPGAPHLVAAAQSHGVLSTRSRRRRRRRRSAPAQPALDPDFLALSGILERPETGLGLTGFTDLYEGISDLFDSESSPWQSRSRRETRCQFTDWYVDFYYMGWENLIIAPKGYQANQCLGQCPVPLNRRLVEASTHAIVKGLFLLNTMSEPQPQLASTLPDICCVPISYSDLSIMFVTANGTVFVERMKEMSVSACGCL